MFLLEEQLAYASQITEYLFLSGVDFLSTDNSLKSLGITYVISVMKNPPDLSSNITHLIIPINDSKNEDIRVYFEKVFNLITEALNQRSKVLIHCEKGMSRSASFVIAWLLYQKHNTKALVSYSDTYDYVKNQRSMIGPNSGFVTVLKMYAANLNFKLTSSNELNISQLPNDLLMSIIDYLTPNDVKNLTSTCTSFFNKNITIIWQRIFYKQCSSFTKEEHAWCNNNNFFFKKAYYYYIRLQKIFNLKINLPLMLGYLGDELLSMKLLKEKKYSHNIIINLIQGACFGGHLEFLLELKQSNIDIFVEDGITKQNILFFATAVNNVTLLKYLSENYYLNWRHKNSQGNNLLFIAAFYGHLEVFKFLLEEKKLDINEINIAGDNILIALCQSNNLELVKYIRINSDKLDPHKVNNSGISAYNLAKKNNTKLVEIFSNWKSENYFSGTLKLSLN